MKKILLGIIIILTIGHQAVASYEVNDNCIRAWELLLNLEIEEAKAVLAEEISINPENYYAYYLEQTCDAYILVINSNEDKYQRFIENYYEKREFMDGKDEDSPYYLACSSEMAIQLGMFMIMNGDMYSGMRKAYVAYKNVYRNLEMYPDFNQSLKLDGFFNVAISSMPPFIKWAVSFFGVSVDVDYGFKVLQDNYVAQKDLPGLNAEAALFIILSAKIYKTPERVYPFSQSLDSSISKLTIHTYLRANLAYRTGHNEEALAILKQIDPNRNELTDVIYSYLMGKILLRKIDDDAEFYLKRYLSYLEKKEYLKEINYCLAQYYLLHNQVSKYESYSEIVRNEGMDMQERDREALYDASLDYIPHPILLKSRLLLEGGYMEAYEESINSYQASHSELLGHKLEHLFLQARYEALIGNSQQAIILFKEVINLGEKEDYFFASEAALRLGDLYLAMDQIEAAKSFYKKSRKLYRNDFYEYIEDKAVKGYKNL